MGRFLRLAAGGWVPASWFQAPPPSSIANKTGRLHIEVVSHCWQYAHLLNYQLSSLILFPPKHCDVTMTVFYALDDHNTAALLKYIESQQVASNITWNWVALPKERLFRRAIGRNMAAKQSRADWVWFTDCDLMFREGCLDGLNELLQASADVLVFPRREKVTDLLADEDPMLAFDISALSLVDIDPQIFTISERGRATGPLQITHGDVARSHGYCETLAYYQRPSLKWCKAYEDRAFRWLMRSDGIPLGVPEVYRLRHVFKGRYTGGKAQTAIRTKLRRLNSIPENVSDKSL